ncbi:MAG: histidine kinase [Geobacteraceae bacterium GWC2_55_20]|nr:MAG: histidine kinase [Geobacteraceae bacterium GWC2_55_20]OGU23084.1 MAG: histidine kinase [Geobacteraceae bacterium GWF2_54_21]HBA72728.1 response regulator [Geobacter sp.]HCE67739.1 response regulator [Geobacter sp.]
MDSRIMIVDDEDMIREAVEILLETEGMDIVTAAGGEECLGHLKAGFRGVILMDIMMPGMDGWDTIREIVEQGFYEGNVIVMLTAMDAPDEKMEGLQEYVSDYITKPFNAGDLLDSLRYYQSLLQPETGIV